MTDITQADRDAALKHVGFDSIEDLHYWATDNNELSRFDALMELLAVHREAAFQAGVKAMQEAAAREAENSVKRGCYASPLSADAIRAIDPTSIKDTQP